MAVQGEIVWEGGKERERGGSIDYKYIETYSFDIRSGGNTVCWLFLCVCVSIHKYRCVRA